MSTINYTDEIKKLVELQTIDKEIFTINRDLDMVPEETAALDAAIKEKENLYKAEEERLKKFQLKRKEKEMELGSKEEAIKKQQNQLFQLKTNQEYSALQKEIDSQKADKSVLEEEILLLFDDIEKAEKALNAQKTLFQQEKNKIEAQKKAIQEKKIVLEQEVKKYEGQRLEFIKGVNNDVLTKYERILHAKDGSAIVPVMGDACGGCNMNLPPQVVNEARLKVSLVICGNCSRILYSNE
ncbi:MAG: C4-type zinc ribbon domain-containing protein [Candidatus Omnitrophica bacterium]|nr:C4-type zinc ribbon domain-containing protein [Candidatus Omnitrophota bacterium]